MENVTLILTVAGTTIVMFFCGFLINLYLLKRDEKSRATGVNQVVNHIYKRIQTVGEIDLILDGIKITVVEKGVSRKAQPQVKKKK